MINKKTVLSILISLLVAVSFMPVTGQLAFADTLQNSFSASGHVTGLAQASAQYNSVTIKWSAYSGAEGYEIYRANKKHGKYKKIKTVTGCSYKDKGNKKLGKKKYYKVRAFVKAGSSKKYTGYSGILAAKPRVGTPTGMTSSGGAGSITIKWKKVAGATGYQVYRATSATGKYKKLVTTKKKSYTNTSVSKGVKYFYKVRAYKKKGGKKYGNYTAPIEGVTMLSGASGFCTTLGSNGVVTSSWMPVVGAVAYELQRATSANGAYTTVGITYKTSMQDKLTASGQYYYRVRAFTNVNGQRVYGAFSEGGRTNAVNQARSWVGCRESNGSHKKIIDVYNKYGPKYGKVGYSAAWCATFVSAVAIATNNTSVIPVDCYCPRMLNNFAKKTRDKKFTPQGGDVVFYDWNWNKVPDHVGMIESVNGDSVTAIEGNYSDSVKRRTFKKGYSLLLAYCLPSYSVNNIVSYTAPKQTETIDAAVEDASVTSEDIEQACDAITASEVPEAEPAEEPAAEESEEPAAEPVSEEPETEASSEAADAITAAEVPEEETAEEPTVEESATEEFAAEEPAAEEPTAEAAAEENAEPMTETETAEKIIEYIQEEEPAADEPVEESEYNAFLVYGICDEMDIEACVVTVTEEDGSESSYNEVVLDGELYILNATEDGGVLEKYTPEEIN